MANEQYASTILVEVEGSPLPADVASLLTYAYVDDSRNLPDLFMLRFRDPGRTVLAKGGFRIGAKVRLRVQTSDPGGPVQLMSGEVTAVERELDATGTVTEVRGLDHAHRLFRGRRVAAYPNMTVADMVRTVTQRASLDVGRIDSVSGVAGGQHDQVSQDNVSDWEFLSRLADLVGAQVVVRDGKLDFLLPDPPSDAPDTSARATRDPLVLEADQNLLSLRAGVTAAEQVPQVVVRGWDAQNKRAVTANAQPSVPGADVSTVDPVGMARGFGSPPFVAARPACFDQGTATATADALAGHLGGASVEVEGVARGNPALRAGTAVALANVGEPFQGKYTLTSTRHLFSEQAGYTTAFTVSGRQERSFYGLAGGGGQGRGGGPAGLGLVPAIVSDVRDPAKSGRVRLTFPWLDQDFTSGWARVAQAGAGAGRGVVILPEVGDEVLVGFAEGDLDAPYVLGGLYNSTDHLPPLGAEPVDANSGEIAVRGLVTRTGHRLELLESAADADGILLATGDGKFVLRLDKKNQTVEISSAGKVSVTAKNGVRIDAGTGPLELKGQQVTVSAPGDVKIDSSGQLTLSGTAGASLKGSQVSVAGQGQTEVTSSGTMTVRGSLVRIN